MADCFKYIEDICFFRRKIKIYFIEWTPSVIFSRSHERKYYRWCSLDEINFNLSPEKKNSVYFMLLTLSGRRFIKIQFSSFPLFPVAYPFGIATYYNITSSARNLRYMTSFILLHGELSAVKRGAVKTSCFTVTCFLTLLICIQAGTTFDLVFLFTSPTLNLGIRNEIEKKNKEKSISN